MSKNGHALTALALATVIVAASPTQAGLLVGVGVIAGASLPDSLEMPSWYNSQRSSRIPHRTLTHWFPLWMFCAVVAEHLPAPWSHLLIGVAISGALHVLVDAASPMGCPVINPFRRHRLKNPLYRTGESSEYPIIAIALVIAGGALFKRGPEMAHLLRSFV
jgi:inner membrane protein